RQNNGGAWIVTWEASESPQVTLNTLGRLGHVKRKRAALNPSKQKRQPTMQGITDAAPH
ncbi:hypothetical protein J6590_107717, partial [Homalodisca vitripennis]